MSFASAGPAATFSPFGGFPDGPTTEALRTGGWAWMAHSEGCRREGLPEDPVGGGLPRGVSRVDERKARRLVVGVDGSEGSERALSFAIWIARGLGAEVVAVHTLRPAAYPDAFPWALGSSPEIWERSWRDARAELERTLEQDRCRPLRDAEVPFRTAVVEGGPETLVQFADREEADMIVVRRRGRGGFSELVLGSVSHQLVHHARRPVVVVPLR